MSTQRSERPQYFEGQYLGAADLAAAVDYARSLSREHALAGHAWGIAIGLALIERKDDATGDVNYYIEPGFAWDGYGRLIAVLSPVQVPASLFAQLPAGTHAVWLRYDETPFMGLRPGFGTCSTEDSFSRVRESYAIEAGSRPSIKDRQSGLILGGVTIDDAREALMEVDSAAPIMCDASVPHQIFPADTARWLVPVGLAAWTGAAFAERTDATKMNSRLARRMIGLVGESVLAADGVLRLRDRFTAQETGVSTDDLCAQDAIKDTDLEVDASGRIVGKELVWVEGNLRAEGQVRLFGTRLELRDGKGDEAGGVPLYARRGVSKNNPAGGQDFQIVIGEKADGAKSRLAVGVAEDYGDIEETFVVQSDGKSAIGSDLPADLKNHSFVVASAANTSMAIVSGAGLTGKIVFGESPDLEPGGLVAFDHGAKKLSLGVETDPKLYAFLTQNGKLGIQTDDPEALADGANDLVINSPQDTGMTILAEPQFTGRIHFADATTGVRRQAGSIVYDFDDDSLAFGTDSNTRVTIDASGNVGIGTAFPSARLQIASNTDNRTLSLDADAIQARNGGMASQLGIQPQGGGVAINAGLAQSSHVVVTNSGSVGIGTDTPGAALHISGNPDVRLDVQSGSGFYPEILFSENGLTQSEVYWNATDRKTYLTNQGSTALCLDGASVGVGFATPQAPLHVRGSRNASAGSLNAHVAIIENTSTGSDADVLALNIGASTAGDSNNFITFFANGSAIGRIEVTSATTANPGAAGTFLRLVSGGADFAECLPRRKGLPPIGAGRLVGVHNGEIAFDTKGASALLVTTDRAVVVGNAPPEDAADGFETVALVGQVPVLVEGPVEAGDFLTPSGRDDGIAVAVAPSRLTSALAGRIAGRAWETSSGGGVRFVKAAVGVAAGAGDGLAGLVAAQAETLRLLSEEVARLRARLEG